MKSVHYVPVVSDIMTGGDEMRFELIRTSTEVCRRKINLSRSSSNESSNATAGERISDYCVTCLRRRAGNKHENKNIFLTSKCIVHYNNIIVTRVFCVV